MGFFADKPTNVYNFPAISLIKELQDAFIENLFYKKVALDATLFGIQRLKDSITYDECNLTINTKWGEFGYRNPYCQPPPEPPPPEPESGDSEHAIAYCANGDKIYSVIGETVKIYEGDGTGTFKILPFLTSTKEWSEEIKRVTQKQLDNVRESWIRNNSIPNANRYRNIKLAIKKTIWTTSRLTNINILVARKSLDGTVSFEFVDPNDPNAMLQQVTTITLEAEQSVPEYPDNWFNVTGGGYGLISTKFQVPPCLPPSRNPPPPKKPPMPECCPGQANNDALLKLILKRIGILPKTVLTSHLTKNGVQPATPKLIQSLADFIEWFAERFDETIGEFEITVQVNDPDDDTKTHTTRLPNLAECVAEMFTMMVHSNMNSDLILNIANRTLIESGQIKQSEFKLFSAVNAIIDYMGFHTDIGVEQMPMLIKPGELSFSKLLKEFDQDVSIVKYTGKETLGATLQTLLQAAAIIRAMHYRKTPGNQTDVASILKKDLTALIGEGGNLSGQVEAFINNVEKVYDGINKPS